MPTTLKIYNGFWLNSKGSDYLQRIFFLRKIILIFSITNLNQTVVRKLKMKNKLILIIYFTTTFTSWACSCPPLKKLDYERNAEYQNAEFIFIGKIYNLKNHKRVFEVKVKEIFKGNLNVGQIINGGNNYYCEPFVNKNGEWLIYGKIENGILFIKECGLSRSLKNPENNNYFNIPIPPPPPNSEITKVQWKNLMKKNRKQSRKFAVRELEYEILELRKRK